MRRPLAGITLFLILGIVCAHCWRRPCALLFIPALVSCACAGVFLRIKFAGTALVWLSVFCLGMLLARHDSVLPRDHIARIKHYIPDRIYQVRGFIKDDPECRNTRTSFTVRAEEVATQQLRWKCRGDILVMIKGAADLSPGQSLALEGTLSRPWGRYYRKRKIYLVLRADSPAFVTATGSAKGTGFRRATIQLKKRAERILAQRLSPLSAGIVSAMLLGEKKQVPQAIYRSMMKTGTVHVLVISGLHVGSICFIIVLVLKMLRIPRRPRFFFCALLLIGYCLLTGSNTPVVRATVMALVFLFAYFLKRQEDIYTSCCLAALIILCANPRSIFDIGFQLSFASVLSIVFFYPRLKGLLRLDTCKNGIVRTIAEGALVSGSAWLGTAGLIAYHFRMVSAVTVLANLCIVPLATLLVLSGVCLLAAEYISPYLALSFIPAIELFVSLLLRINSFFAGLPWAYFRLP